MSSWWDAVRDWFRSGRKGDFPEPNRDDPDPVQHFTGREDWLTRRKNLTTGMKSREISEAWSAKIRAQAFFSARVEQGHILDKLREVSDAFTRGEIGQAEARTRLKEFLVSQGYDPQRGGLSNLASAGRLNLILEQNARMAYAVGRWQEGMDPDIKERFPCWRYVGSTSAAPRDSHARYAGHVYAKDDPIWHTIFPPSDFGCKCSVEDCDDPAEKAPENIRPAESGFAFDPAHAFEEFDYDAIKDAELRERTREGVEKILKEGVWSDPSDRSDRSDRSDKMPEPEPEPEAKPESKPATQSETKATQTLKPTPQLETKPEKMPEARPSSIEHNAMKEARLREKIQEALAKNNQQEKENKITRRDPPASKPQETHEQHLARRQKQLARAKRKRTEREAKLIEADLIKGKHTREQDLAATNPNYVAGRNDVWENNCQRCVTAYEARRRGIDVEALPLPVPVTQQWKDQMSHSDGWASAFRNGNIIDCSASSGTAARNKVIKAMKDMPDGARCAVQTIWKGNGGGHVFIAEKINGNVVFVDPQQHGSPDQSNYQWSDDSNGRETHIMRLDNLKFSANVKECCKGVPR